MMHMMLCSKLSKNPNIRHCVQQLRFVQTSSLLARTGSSFGSSDEKWIPPIAFMIAAATLLAAATSSIAAASANDEENASTEISSSTSSTGSSLYSVGAIIYPTGDATTTACDFLFLPSSSNSSKEEKEKDNAVSTVAQKQTSQKRNKTMALIESFSTATTSPQQQYHQQPNQPSSAVAVVDNTYKIEWDKPLGMGAFGGVYTGVHRTTGKKVAIKQIPKHCTQYETFQREINALIKISQNGGHPNLNTLHETFVGSNENDDNNYYLVLDLCTGNEMFDELCNNGTFSEGTFIGCFMWASCSAVVIRVFVLVFFCFLA
jgi:hypothetical protein